MNIIEIFTKSIFLIISFDSDLWEIIILSLYVSISALIIASILGLLIGYYFPIMTLLSSFGLALLMTLGFGLRLIVKDGLIKSIPALLYLIVNVFIFLNNLNNNF